MKTSKQIRGFKLFIFPILIILSASNLNAFTKSGTAKPLDDCQQSARLALQTDSKSLYEKLAIAVLDGSCKQDGTYNNCSCATEPNTNGTCAVYCECDQDGTPPLEGTCSSNMNFDCSSGNVDGVQCKVSGDGSKVECKEKNGQGEVVCDGPITP